MPKIVSKPPEARKRQERISLPWISEGAWLCQHLFKIKKKFLAVLGLHCCVWAFSSCDERGLLFVSVRGLLIAVASLVAEHGLQARGLQ